MDHLSPCPFCESVDIAVELREDGLYINDPDRVHPGRHKAYAAICNSCGARGSMVKVSEDQPHNSRYLAVEHAADLWNNRVGKKNNDTLPQ